MKTVAALKKRKTTLRKESREVEGRKGREPEEGKGMTKKKKGGSGGEDDDSANDEA